MSHPVVPVALPAPALEPEPEVQDFPEPPAEAVTGPEPSAVPFPEAALLPEPAVEAVTAEEADETFWHLALADELEAALLAAMEDAPHDEEPSARTRRLIKALALDSQVPDQYVPEAPPVGATDGSYLALLQAYGPFPVLLPVHRDFRPVLALSVLLGLVGADRFYERKYITGALKLLTAGGLGIWWIADIISILNGRATDKARHHYTGKTWHRVIAWILTAALFGGLAGAAVHAVVPITTQAINEALYPKPARVLTWGLIAEVAGGPEPVMLATAGERFRFTYSFQHPVYAYLQNLDDPAAPAQGLLLYEKPAAGDKEIAVDPGRYQLVVLTEDTAWTVKVEDLALRG